MPSYSTASVAAVLVNHWPTISVDTCWRWRCVPCSWRLYPIDTCWRCVSRKWKCPRCSETVPHSRSTQRQMTPRCVTLIALASFFSSPSSSLPLGLHLVFFLGLHLVFFLGLHLVFFSAYYSLLSLYYYRQVQVHGLVHFPSSAVALPTSLFSSQKENVLRTSVRCSTIVSIIITRTACLNCSSHYLNPLLAGPSLWCLTRLTWPSFFFSFTFVFICHRYLSFWSWFLLHLLLHLAWIRSLIPKNTASYFVVTFSLPFSFLPSLFFFLFSSPFEIELESSNSKLCVLE